MKPYLTALATSLLALSASAQGPMSPPGTPAPTQKSLQEIWDRLHMLESETVALLDGVGRLASQNNTLLQRNALLMDAAGVELPWRLDTGFTAVLGGDAGLAFLPNALPVVSFREDASGDIRVASSDSSGVWQHGLLASSSAADSWYSGIAASSSGEVAAVFINLASNSVYYTSSMGGVGPWSTLKIDSLVQDKPCALAFSGDAQPMAAFFTTDGSPVRVLRRLASTWVGESVPVTSPDLSVMALAAGPGGFPALAVASSNEIYFAQTDGVVWDISNPDTGTSPGDWVSMAMDASGQPAVAWYDTDANVLRVARKNGPTWYPSSVESLASDQASLAFGPDGRACLAYRSVLNPNSIRFAREESPGVWHSAHVDDAPFPGGTIRLSFRPDGQPVIVHGSPSGGGLRVLVRGTSTTW